MSKQKPRLLEALSQLAAANTEISTLKGDGVDFAAEKAARERAEEKERIVDAAISVLAMSNTRDTLKGNKLPRENPYWTPAQDDVEKAIMREIEHREAREKAEARVQELEENISPEVLRELNARQSEREKNPE